MKYIVIIIWVAALASTGLSCSEGDPLVMNIKPSFTIPLSNKLAPNAKCQKFFETSDGQQLLYYSGDNTNSIAVFDLDKGQKIREMKFREEGPGGVGYIGGFVVLSPDSILLASEGLRYNFIVNQAGEIIYKLEHEEIGQYPEFTGLWSIFFRDTRKIGNKLYLPQSIPYIDGVRPEGEFRPILLHDLNTSKSQMVDFLFPEEIYESKMPTTILFTVGKDCLLYGFTGSNEFYVHDIESGLTKKVASKSAFIEKPMEDWSQVGGMDDYMMHAATNARYVGNYYDKYRNCYYRIVTHPPKDPKVAKDMYVQLSQYPVRISIILMDEDFNTIQEFMLPEGKYFAGGMFINKDGIHLPKSNPAYMQVEDSISYDLITFDKI